MREFKHDQLKQNGVDVDLKQLAHDLAIIRISKDAELKATSHENEYYDAYVKAYGDFMACIINRCRRDK